MTQNNDPYMHLREALHEVFGEMQIDIKELEETRHYDEADHLQAKLEEFESLAKQIENLLFPEVDTPHHVHATWDEQNALNRDMEGYTPCHCEGGPAYCNECRPI